VFPTTAQKGILAQWFGISRVAYNKSIDFLNQEGTVANFMKNKKEIYYSLPEWSSFCPSLIRQAAIKDAHDAVKSQKAKAKKAESSRSGSPTMRTTQASGKPFSMKFRSRKDNQIIKFSVSSYQNGLYKTKLGFLKLSESLPENICDASLTLVNGQYHLNVPYRTILHSADNQGEMVALDPGVRTFQTYYSPSSCGEIGAKCIGRIYRLCQHLDNLMSRKLWKPASRVRIKIKNLVSELHFQAANFLTKNFSTILIPTFETSQMVSKKAIRKIRTKTARAMMTCSHYQFRQRLINKALENGCEVKVVTEEYTSKTASWTGEIINIGSRKTIESNGVTVDRDLNGARGIFLKALVDSPDLRKKVASVNFS
jgi:putative transposase